MKFALQVKDEDFERAEQILGSLYDDKSDIIIYDPVTGDPPQGKFVLIAISNVWIPKYSDRIAGYINGIEDISDLINTADKLSLNKNKSNFISKKIPETDNNKTPISLEGIGMENEEEIGNTEEIEDTMVSNFNNNFLDVSQDEDVQEFFVESAQPKIQEFEPKSNDKNDFSFAEDDLSQEVISPESVFQKKEVIEEEEKTKKDTIANNKKETIEKRKEIKRYYFSDSDMSYTVAVSIHIKYSGKVIAIVDDKLFQKYGDFLDENVYIFRTFKEVSESSLENYILIVTAKDKAKDKDILQYSKNPIVYWEEINNWIDKYRD